MRRYVFFYSHEPICRHYLGQQYSPEFISLFCRKTVSTRLGCNLFKLVVKPHVKISLFSESHFRNVYPFGDVPQLLFLSIRQFFLQLLIAFACNFRNYSLVGHIPFKSFLVDPSNISISINQNTIKNSNAPIHQFPRWISDGNTHFGPIKYTFNLYFVDKIRHFSRSNLTGHFFLPTGHRLASLKTFLVGGLPGGLPGNPGYLSVSHYVEKSHPEFFILLAGILRHESRKKLVKNCLGISGKILLEKQADSKLIFTGIQKFLIIPLLVGKYRDIGSFAIGFAFGHYNKIG